MWPMTYFRISHLVGEGDFDEIINLLEPMVRKKIDQFYLNMLFLAYERTGQPEKIHSMALLVLEKRPNNFNILKIIGNSYARLGDENAAVLYLTKALNNIPNFHANSRSLELIRKMVGFFSKERGDQIQEAEKHLSEADLEEQRWLEWAKMYISNRQIKQQ